MRLDGDKIVDVSEQDAADLQTYLRSCASRRGLYPESVRRLRETYVESVGRFAGLHSVGERFMAMVGLALANTPKASPAGSEVPFRGILARADETLHNLAPKGFTTDADLGQWIPGLSSYETEEGACASLWSWLSKRQRDCAHDAGDSSNVVLWAHRHRITQSHDTEAIRPLVRWIRGRQ